MPLGIEITAADGEKCPRCWRKLGVPSNYEGRCDDCCAHMLDGLKDYVDRGSLSVADARQMWNRIKRAQLHDLFRFRRDLMTLPDDTKQALIDQHVQSQVCPV